MQGVVSWIGNNRNKTRERFAVLTESSFTLFKKNDHDGVNYAEQQLQLSKLISLCGNFRTNYEVIATKTKSVFNSAAVVQNF